MGAMARTMASALRPVAAGSSTHIKMVPLKPYSVIPANSTFGSCVTGEMASVAFLARRAISAAVSSSVPGSSVT